jgi:hypothetical protein
MANGFNPEKWVHGEQQQKDLNDIATVVAYLAWQDPNDMWGGRKNHEARKAFCSLLGVPETVYSVMRGDKDGES